jgi:predicted negative regulator of RcsB-dependent stress response
MANPLDLEEQEQLDQLKHFWKQYGNVITWALIVVLGAFASWNFYNYWQRSQAIQAAALYDEIERVSQSPDRTPLDRVFSDMRDRYATSIYAQQAGLLVAKQHYEGGNVDGARSALAWVSEKSSDTGFQSIARLRLAGILSETQDYVGAIKLLEGSFPPAFDALAADRRGDILLLQGKKAEAIQAFNKAFKLFEERSDYRRLVEVKLNSLGVDPSSAVAARGDATALTESSK